MKDHAAFYLALLLPLLAVIPAAAEPGHGAPELDKLRRDYAEARDFFKATPKPLVGDEGFAAKLRIWSEMYTRQRELSKAMLAPLVRQAAEAPADRFPRLRDELRAVRGDLVDGPTQASHDNLAYVCQVILPHVRSGALPADCAALFVELTTPDAWVRGYDARTRWGLPSEPTGLLIQDVHSLAKARAGDFDAARKESDLLLKKAEILLGGRLPNLAINHGPKTRTKPSLQREFLLHRALIESLAGEKQAAQDHLHRAKRIEEPDKEVARAQEPLFKRLAD